MSNPKSHICYGFATHVVILDDEGKVSEVYAAHDSGRVINPIAIQGQIEGGVLMGMGYALTEDWPLKDGVPQVKYGTLGLFRATDIPHILTPSTWRRTSSCPWPTAARASERSRRSRPPRPCRTPTTRGTASSAAACPCPTPTTAAAPTAT